MPRRRTHGIICPVCRKVVFPLDDEGWLDEGDPFRFCRHFVGVSMDEEVPVMAQEFEDLPRAMRALGSHLNLRRRDRSALVAALAPLVANAAGLVRAIDGNREGQLEEWLWRLPELQTGRIRRHGVGPAWGNERCLFASVPNQRTLVRKLAGIRDAIERLRPGRRLKN